MSNGNTVATIDVTFENVENLDVDFGAIYRIEDNHILYATTATWDSQTTLVALAGYLYIYSDYKQDEEEKNVAGIKVGDGVTLLSELPFTDEILTADISAIETALESKADATTVETALGLKADKSDTYTKNEVDTALLNKADKEHTYTKSEVNTALADKLDKSGLVAGQGISVADVSGNKQVNNIAGIYTVKSTNTTSSTQGRWTGNIDIPDLYNGLTIQYLTTRHTSLSGVSAEDNCMLNLTCSGGVESGYVDIIFDRNTFVTEEYQIDECITLTYFDPAHSPTSDYAWVVQKPTVTQTHTTENAAIPVLLAGNPSDVLKSGNCGAKKNNNFKYNPSSGELTINGDLTYSGSTSLTSEVQRLDGRINNLPVPMQFKGSLGVNGTITDLPSASASNDGYTYKVITAGIYQGLVTKVGDVVTSNGSEWVLIPSGDVDTDTWRAIKVNGTEKLASGISSGAVDFVDTDNIEVAFDTTGNKVKIATKNIYTQTQIDTALSNKANSSDVYTKQETDTALENKLNKASPTGTGAVSINRKANTTVGYASVAAGFNCEASTTATVAVGFMTKASAPYARAEGSNTLASGTGSHAEGDNTTASGSFSHADGQNTNANHKSQNVFGEYNIADNSTAQDTERGNFVEIVGNGTADNARSNARTLDWSGNEVLAGDLTINGTVSLTSKLSAYDSIIGNSLSATLTAGQTSVTIQDASITSGSILSVFTDVYGLQPTLVSATTGSVTLTFNEQGVDIHIIVEVK